MRILAALALGLLLASVLSGCFVEDDDAKSGTGTSTSASGSGSGSGSGTKSGSNSGTGTGAPGSTKTNGTNHAPTANLTASALNGTVPLNVTFSLAGKDADNNSLTWTLSVDGTQVANGTKLPANATHQFTAAGSFVVTLRVSDGKANATANVTVQAAGIVVDPPGPHVCNLDPDQAVGPLYYTTAGGGNWVFMESNGKDGLQVGNTWVGGEAGNEIGESNPDWVDCIDGDTLVF